MKTLLKTTTYCCMHFAVALFVAYAVTRNWQVATTISVIEPLVQTFFFFWHELAWQGKLRLTPRATGCHMGTTISP